MIDQSKVGTDWSADELDLIVAAYFDLYAQPSDQPRGWKADYLRSVDADLQRGGNSIGRKLSNISFVASTLGLPPLPGFGALPNVQRAIIPAIDRYLTAHPEVLADDFLLPVAQRWGGGGSPLGDVTEGATRSFQGVSEPTTPFIGGDGGIQTLTLTEAPPPGPPRSPRPEGLARLVRKYDPAARDHRNRALGKLGEEHVFHHERALLIAHDRPDLARRIEWTSQERGDGAGYDIRSFDPTGAERLIEVKATRGGPATPFYLTRTEREVSLERPAAWRLYRLHDLSTAPGLFVLPPPLEASVTLEAETWRAGF